MTFPAAGLGGGRRGRPSPDDNRAGDQTNLSDFLTQSIHSRRKRLRRLRIIRPDQNSRILRAQRDLGTDLPALSKVYGKAHLPASLSPLLDLLFCIALNLEVQDLLVPSHDYGQIHAPLRILPLTSRIGQRCVLV